MRSRRTLLALSESLSHKRDLLHILFVVSLSFKGLLALLEVIGGLAVSLAARDTLLGLIRTLVAEEIAEDPGDPIANYLVHFTESFLGAQAFAAIYLFAHGIIKAWLVFGLLRRKLWYYPVSIGVFFLFVAYQMYRFSYMHSTWLISVSVLDVIVILLTWHEYRYLRKALARDEVS